MQQVLSVHQLSLINSRNFAPKTSYMSTFQNLWNNHPTGDFPCSSDGKKHFDNQCAIRMGVAFEKSGISTKTWAVARCWHHKIESRHILRAEELANALTQVKVSGMKKVEKYAGKDGFAKMKKRTGIVFFKNYYGAGSQGDHIDLWNGWRLTSLYSPWNIYAGFGDQYDKGDIWFWEVA